MAWNIWNTAKLRSDDPEVWKKAAKTLRSLILSDAWTEEPGVLASLERPTLRSITELKGLPVGPDFELDLLTALRDPYWLYWREPGPMTYLNLRMDWVEENFEELSKRSLHCTTDFLKYEYRVVGYKVRKEFLKGRDTQLLENVALELYGLPLGHRPEEDEKDLRWIDPGDLRLYYRFVSDGEPVGLPEILEL